MDEKRFLQWYRDWAGKFDLDPNPDNPLHKYDYRAAYKSGATPDKEGHWPSTFKSADHPRRFVGGVDTRTGAPMTISDYLMAGLSGFQQ